jgi:hypothetical protein
MNNDIQTALDAIKANLPTRQRYISYYEGNHELAFATEKFKTSFGQTLKSMRDNLCPIIVDAPADRLEVINFSGDREGTKTDETSWELWQREQMELVSNDTHIEAIKAGSAYVIVWSDNENKARFYLQDSRNCVIIEDEETGDPLFGAKQWLTTEERVRLNLYYADRIEKYITQKKPRSGMPLKAEHFVPLTRTNAENETVENALTPNPFGVIPMFEFRTDAILEDAIPIQDSLNKTFADRLVAQEFAAFRQRWATGLAPPTNELTGIPTLPFKAGVDRLLFTDDAGVKFGEFQATDIEMFLKAADADRLEMARVSGTPLHFFSINTTDAISGKALKALEARFTKKCTRLSINFGVVWAKAMMLALAIEGSTAPGNLTAQWSAVEIRDEAEFIDNQIKKQELGVPDDVLLEEYGYTEEDIARFKKLREEQEPEVIVDPAVKLAQEQMNGR